jgi:hypothetical protein
MIYSFGEFSHKQEDECLRHKTHHCTNWSNSVESEYDLIVISLLARI